MKNLTHTEVIDLIFNCLGSLATTLIFWLGPAMGLSARFCSPYVKRGDRFRFFREITCRYPTGDQGKFGELLKHYRMDIVAAICPGRWGLNRPVNQQVSFIVGFEVKASKADLWQDDKILFYLGWTDFFFLVVPDSMTSDAMAKASRLDHRIGVIEVDDRGHCHIVRTPLRQHVLAANRQAIMAEMIFSCERISNVTDYRDCYAYATADAAKENDIDITKFVSVSQVVIRSDFAGKADTYINNIHK